MPSEKVHKLIESFKRVLNERPIIPADEDTIKAGGHIISGETQDDEEELERFFPKKPTNMPASSKDVLNMPSSNARIPAGKYRYVEKESPDIKKVKQLGKMHGVKVPETVMSQTPSGKIYKKKYELPDIELDDRFQNPEIKYADYDGRKIVKYKCKDGSCGLFYVSKGETDDFVKEKGDVYPISGIMRRSKSSNKIGRDIMPDEYNDFRYNGWIMKNVAGKTREEALTNPTSYYKQPGLRNISNYYTKYPEKLQALMKPENELSLNDLMSDFDNEFETNPKYAPRFLYDNAMAIKKERETTPAVKPAMASQQAEPVKESYTEIINNLRRK
jgi:hypothetical protein